jgi:putative redox protein
MAGFPIGVKLQLTREVDVAMSLTASARSIPGTLRQEVLIDGRHRLLTDEPEAVGGNGSAPAPHELFPAALAACVSTTLVMYARTKKWRLDGVDVDVEYDHRATPRRFEIDIRVTGDLSAAQLDMLDKVAAACPVRRGIETGIEFVERLELMPTPFVHERGAA